MTEIAASKIQELTRLHDEIVGAVRMTLNKAIEAGKILTEIKGSLPHGEFTDWIEENVAFDLRTAQRYMRAYKKRDELKYDSVSFLTEAYEATTQHKDEIPDEEFNRLLPPPFHFSSFELGGFDPADVFIIAAPDPNYFYVSYMRLASPDSDALVVGLTRPGIPKAVKRFLTTQFDAEEVRNAVPSFNETGEHSFNPLLFSSKEEYKDYLIYGETKVPK